MGWWFARVTPEQFADCFKDTNLWWLSFQEAKCPGEYKGFDRGLYKALYKRNLCLQIVAFFDDVPVGWCSGICSQDSYVKGYVMTQESIYIHPDYRTGFATGKLIKEFERQAAKMPGVLGVLWTVHPGSPLEKTLNHHYQLYSKNYLKEFNHEKPV